MARQIIDIGTAGNNNTGDSIRVSFNKTNLNFTDLYTKYETTIDNTKFDFFQLTNVPATHLANQILTLSNDNTTLTARSITSSDNSVGITVNANNSTIDLTVLNTHVNDDVSPKLAFSLNANSQTIGDLADPGPAAAAAYNTNIAWSDTTIGALPVTVNYAIENFIKATAGTITGSNTATGIKTAGKYTVSAQIVSNGGFIGAIGSDTSRNTSHFSSINSPSLVSNANTALTVDSGTTGAINIGSSAYAKTITIGNATGTTGISLLSGSGEILVSSAIMIFDTLRAKFLGLWVAKFSNK